MLQKCWLTFQLSRVVSRYGNRNVSTRTNDLLNPRLLATSTSNEDEKAKTKKMLDDLSSRDRTIQNEVRHSLLMFKIVHGLILDDALDHGS